MKKLIIFLHGALSSAKCWNYINFIARRQLKGSQVLYLEYDITKKPAVEIVADLTAEILSKAKLHDKEVILIGHSYGGILAIELARVLKQSTLNQIQAMTISAPLGGSGAASLMKIFKSSSHLLANVASYDPFMLNFKKKGLPCPVHSVITSSQTSYNWMLPGRNDTVVTVESQAFFNNHHLHSHKYVECNHFEVLMSPEVGKIVADLASSKISFSEHFSKKSLQAA